MAPVIAILLIIAVVKLAVFGTLVFVVFREDIKTYFSSKRKKTQPLTPQCVYCQSVWTRAIDEGKASWDEEDLVLTTTFECQHCHLPFWHVERVRAGVLKH